MSNAVQIFVLTLSRLISLLVLACLAVHFNCTELSADDDDHFEGAVWRFSMTPKARGLEPVKGRYRVSKHVFYQCSKPKTHEFDTVVGKNHPTGKKTRSVFEDLRAVDENRNWHKGLKGTAHLEMDRFGEWSGRFIDSEGRHWDFQCSRVQE